MQVQHGHTEAAAAAASTAAEEAAHTAVAAVVAEVERNAAAVAVEREEDMNYLAGWVERVEVGSTVVAALAGEERNVAASVGLVVHYRVEAGSNRLEDPGFPEVDIQTWFLIILPLLELKLAWIRVSGSADR